MGFKNKEDARAYKKAWYEKNKARLLIKSKAYREANAEKIKAYKVEYDVKNKEQLSIQKKTYYENNKESCKTRMKSYNDEHKEQLSIQKKTYYENNKEKIHAAQKEYRNTAQGLKSAKIAKWKSRGVIGDLKAFYDNKYLPAINCDVCEKVFKSSTDKCMDHDHVTGEIRFVLCANCNINDKWIKVLARKNIVDYSCLVYKA